MPTCNICKYAGKPIYKSPCSECKEFSEYEYENKKTNADIIRSMSEEELAKHLVDIGWDCHLCAEHGRLDNEPLLRGEKCDEKCVEHCLEWLQMPAEVIE